MIDSPYMPVPKKLSLTEDPQVQRTRHIFMIMLGVCLGLAVLGLSGGIFEFISEIHNVNPRRDTQADQALASILYCRFGLFVAYRYSRLGLRIFAWLAVIALITIGIGIGILLLFTVIRLIALYSIHDGQVDLAVIAMTVGASVAANVYVTAFILLMIIIFAFKLARFIDANKSLIV